MKKTLLMIICFGLFISLNACTSKKNPTLTKPLFVSVKLISVSKDDISLSSDESSKLIDLLKFSSWKIINRTTKLVTDPDFVLIDKENTSYYFSQQGQTVLVEIVKKDETNIVSYTFEGSTRILIDASLKSIVTIAYARQKILAKTITSANIGPDYYDNTSEFTLSIAQSNEFRNEIEKTVGSWIYREKVSTLPELITARVIFDESLSLVFTIISEDYFLDVVTIDDQSNQIIESFELTKSDYNSLLKSLKTLRGLLIKGASSTVKNAVFTEGSFSLDGYLTWLVPNGKIVLGASESDQFREWLNLDLWMLRSPLIELDVINTILYAQNDYVFTFGGYQAAESGYYASYCVVTNLKDLNFKEVYQVEEPTKIYSFLVQQWNPAFPLEITNFEFTIISTAFNDPTVVETGIGYKTNVLTETQFGEIKTILSYDQWTLDKEPGKYHFGWLPSFILLNESNQQLSLYVYDEKTVIRVFNLFSGMGEYADLWYVGPKAISQNLQDYTKTTFPD